MTQKRMKGTLSNLEAPKKKKKKISDANTNLITDSKKFSLQERKKKSNADTTKANRISDSKKFKLSRCQQQKKKKKSVHTCKEKSIVEMDIVAHSQEAILSQQDVMWEILSRLPVRSLVRFKCVAKSWDLTSDPYFRMKHQSHHQVNSLRFLLDHTYVSRINTKPVTLRNLYSASSLSSPDDVQNIDYLSSNENPYFHILCDSCDGLVVILVATDRDTNELVFLWNPSTRESIQLPFPIFGITDCAFGLGYDPTARDYKILTIHNGKSQTQCAILALKSGSWRNVDIQEPHIFRYAMLSFGFNDRLPFLHGAFHWIPRSFWIVSFNISNEVYTEIPLLEHMYMCGSYNIAGHIHVSVLDGMLCFSSAYTVDLDVFTFVLWAMKDYGVKESWTQLFKVKVPCSHHVVKPIYRFPDGDVLLHCRGPAIDKLRTTAKGRFKLWSGSVVKRLGFVEIITFNETLISPKSLI